jgi:hypothetical protein
VSTPQTLWANRTLALLARLQRVNGVQAHWTAAGADACRLTVRLSGSTATAVLQRELLLRAFDGDDSAQVNVLVVLSELLRSLPSSA